MRKLLLLFVILMLAAATLSAAVYKWVDETGTTHYSEIPTPGRKNEKLNMPPQPPKEAIEEAQQKLQKLQSTHASSELQQIPLPGNTGALPGLQRDTLRMLMLLDTSQDRVCQQRKIIDTEMLEINMQNKTVLERWTVDRCGKFFKYRITFVSISPGDTLIKILLPPVEVYDLHR